MCLPHRVARIAEVMLLDVKDLVVMSQLERGFNRKYVED